MVWANRFHESLLTFGDDCTRSNAASRIRTRTLTPVERDARARTNNLLAGDPNDLCARHKQIFGIDKDASALEGQLRSVTIAGRGRRAISAVMY